MILQFLGQRSVPLVHYFRRAFWCSHARYGSPLFFRRRSVHSILFCSFRSIRRNSVKRKKACFLGRGNHYWCAVVLVQRSAISGEGVRFWFSILLSSEEKRCSVSGSMYNSGLRSSFWSDVSGSVSEEKRCSDLFEFSLDIQSSGSEFFWFAAMNFSGTGWKVLVCCGCEKFWTVWKFCGWRIWEILDLFEIAGLCFLSNPG